MDDSALLADTKIMAGPSPAKATLLSLPIEMLDRIFWLVDKSDLINLRLVCKLVHAVANGPFAVRHFSTRCHVVSEHSLKALLAISEHANFGAHIKTIIFSPARAVLAVLGSGGSKDDGFVVDDSFVKSGRFSNLMQQILSNLKQHFDSIAIGVDEDHCLGYGCQYLASPERQLCYGERAFDGASELGAAHRTSETFELLVAEMKVAALNITGLDINLVYHSYYDVRHKTHKAIDKFLKSHDSPINLHFHWDSNGLLEYKHLQSYLRLSGSTLLEDSSNRLADSFLLHEVIQWLANRSLTELCLQDLNVERSARLNGYFLKSLQKITLEDFKLGSVCFRWGLLSSLFKRLSRLPDLKHVEFRRLHYSLPQEIFSSTYSIQLLSGRYVSCWTSLLLIFPNSKSEIEITGLDVSRQLENLAAYADAAERRKVHEVHSAQQVMDYRVMGADVSVSEEEDFETLVCPDRFDWRIW